MGTINVERWSAELWGQMSSSRQRKKIEKRSEDGGLGTLISELEKRRRNWQGHREGEAREGEEQARKVERKKVFWEERETDCVKCC